MVNAFYSPNNNQICKLFSSIRLNSIKYRLVCKVDLIRARKKGFPAGILQSPFYDASVPK